MKKRKRFRAFYNFTVCRALPGVPYFGKIVQHFVRAKEESLLFRNEVGGCKLMQPRGNIFSIILPHKEKQILRVYQRAREAAITSILINAICGAGENSRN